MRVSLCQHSIDVLLQNQDPSGAFLACPTFPAYQYSWFRDGSFIAYALDEVGYHERAEYFHQWCARTVLRHRKKIEGEILSTDQQKGSADIPHFHCRFTVTGDEVPGHWGTHQLDGLGTWLWGFEQHQASAGMPPLDESTAQALDLVAGYLRKLWPLPCSDCWEENETEIHAYTLAAIYAGLMAHSRLRGSAQSSQTALEIKKYVLNRLTSNGYLRKNLHDHEIDSSLFGVAVPYGLVELDSPIFQETVVRIEKDLLSPDGGIHRYKKDTYYGGGEWVLLTAWYGWVKLKLGDGDSARKALIWMESQADANGNLPEQVNHHLNDRKAYSEWVERWGQSAAPLLWSHAMYIVLRKLIG